MNKPFTLYHSGRLGVPNNCLYPHPIEVVDEASMKEAVSFDYVAVAYTDGYRNNDNFQHSNCLMLDCDNDHSEDPAEWVTPEMLRQALPGVCFAVHYSRNHNRQKSGRAARPKFHCFFPISDQTDPEKYKAMKQRVQQLFPFFDPNAVDAARFFFGTKPANVEIFDGEDSIEDVLMDYAFDEMEMASEAYTGRVINEGSRNNTMSHFAGRILKRYGDTEAAYNAFIAEAEKCSPPLDPQELNTIWRSALQFHSRVKAQDGYIPPEQYNSGFQYEPDDYTDVGEAALLSKIYGDRLRFSPATDYKIPLPTIVADATEKYREQNNWLAHFINDRCEVGDEYEAKSGEFYQAYRTCCAEVPDFTRSTAEFYTALESAGFERRKTKHGNLVMGVRLKGDGSGVEEEFLN